MRDLETLQVIRTWSLPLASHQASHAAEPTTVATAPQITEFAVSPTSPPYVLVFAQKARTAWILDPEMDGEQARIEIGNEGAVAMRWADLPEPTVMSWSAHHASRPSLKELAIRSLTTRSCVRSSDSRCFRSPLRQSPLRHRLSTSSRPNTPLPPPTALHLTRDTLSIPTELFSSPSSDPARPLPESRLLLPPQQPRPLKT